jgi:Carboxypeptidase regulatory-like domain
MPTVQRRLIRIGIGFGTVAATLALTPLLCVAGTTATISGVVRDTQGVAQMGAAVEVLAAGSTSVAMAFTDMYGRYRVANLVPGRYQVRATAALFVPAMRRDLRLSTGMRATVNLTLNMLSDPTVWLPAQRRGPDEPGDDWTWTLRSSVNRPILRVLGDGDVVMVGVGRAEGQHELPVTARVSVAGGDGGFGAGDVRAVFAMERELESGADGMLRASVGVLPEVFRGAAGAASVPFEVDGGYQQKLGLAGVTRTVVSYASHPEMTSSGGAPGGADVSAGMQVARMTSAEKIALGDTVDLEAGGTVYAVRTAGVAVQAQPFVRVTVHPGKVWALQYRLATARDVQRFDALDSIALRMPVVAMSGGRVGGGSLGIEGGSHHEIALSRTMGRGVVEAAVYRDSIDRPAIEGVGRMGAAEMAAGAGASGIVADSAAGQFGFLGAGYGASGVNVTVTEPLTPELLMTVAYATGRALAATSAGTARLPEMAAGLHAEDAQAVTATLNGRVERTGTKVRAGYRWQPRRLATGVDPYAGDQGYLSFYVRQAVRLGDLLPPGLEATVDVTNLLAEGYLPFLSADGRTLFLAESPRTVRGGLSFTF